MENYQSKLQMMEYDLAIKIFPIWENINSIVVNIKVIKNTIYSDV